MLSNAHAIVECSVKEWCKLENDIADVIIQRYQHLMAYVEAQSGYFKH